MEYRITYTHRQWVGKPDPAGFGRGYLTSHSRRWITEQAESLRLNGCRVLRIEARGGVGQPWEKMP